MPTTPGTLPNLGGLKGRPGFEQPTMGSMSSRYQSLHEGRYVENHNDMADFDEEEMAYYHQHQRLPVELVVNASFEAKHRSVDASLVSTMVKDVDEAKRRHVTVDQLYTERTPLVLRLKFLVRGLQGRPKYESEEVFKAYEVFARSLGGVRPSKASTEYMAKTLAQLNTVTSRVFAPLLETYIKSSKGMDAMEADELEIIEEHELIYKDIKTAEDKARDDKKLKKAATLKIEKYHAHLDWVEKVQLKTERVKGKYIPEIAVSEEDIAEAKEEYTLRAIAARAQAGSPSPQANGADENSSGRKSSKREKRRSKSRGGTGGDASPTQGSGEALDSAGSITSMPPLPTVHSPALYSAMQVKEWVDDVSSFKADVIKTYEDISEDARVAVRELEADLKECLEDIDENQDIQTSHQESMDTDQDTMDAYIEEMKALQEKMQQLRDDMDERQDEMDEVEAKRRALLVKQTQIDEDLTMAKGWQEAKEKLQEFTKVSAAAMEKCSNVELDHKVSNIDDTLQRFQENVEIVIESHEFQKEKLVWLEKQIKEADERDEEETEAEMRKQKEVLNPIWEDFVQCQEDIEQCMEELNDKRSAVGGGAGASPKKKEKKKESKKAASPEPEDDEPEEKSPEKKEKKGKKEDAGDKKEKKKKKDK